MSGLGKTSDGKSGEESVAKGVTPQVTVPAATDKDRWARVAVADPAAERKDSKEESRKKWERVYNAFGATNESQRDEVFAAVVAYMYVNGTSPRGGYSKPIRTASLGERPASAITVVTGTMEGDVRRFMRGRLADSINFMRYNESFRLLPEIIDKMHEYGIGDNRLVTMADWVHPSSLLTEEESLFAKNLKTMKFSGVRAVAGGPTVVMRDHQVTPETPAAPAPPFVTPARNEYL